MTGFALNPPRTALVDASGNVTPEWYRWFVQIQRMLGGPSDPFDDALLLSQTAEYPVGAAIDEARELVPPMVAPPPLDPLTPPAMTVPASDPLTPPTIPTPADDFLWPPRYGA